METDRKRFVGGMRYGARPGLSSGTLNLTWPLAVIEIDRDQVLVSPRGVLNKVLKTVEMPRGAINEVETGYGLLKAGIRFRLEGPDDGTVFWTVGRTKPVVIQALRQLGLRVV